MKVIPFKVPVTQAESVTVNEDILPFFYGHVHRHKEMQLTLILKGEGTLIVGNYTQAFKPGDMYIIGANQPHIFRSDDSYYREVAVDNVHAIHIFIEHENTLQFLSNLPEMEFIKKLMDNTLPGLQVPDEYLAHASRMFLKVNRVSGFKRLITFIKLVRYLTEEVKHYKSLSTGHDNMPFSGPEDNRMNQIYEYTIQHYSENITLERIAAVVHITPHAFCKYFKKHTRKTYKHFLNEVRINEACKKIINGDFDCISSIAYATGFNSPINFNKVFKKMTDKSPSEYIKEYKHNWDNAVRMLKEPA
ncbi:AraC family transcriptional regulator [Pontibacter arcticus]|uniref:AraC family transcriptional regulator n=1 Tax=Pontibacter arcticus TaxID=2080288 RepID=A0A364RIK3_9BACT|nr:AraC family transcriptional regulator [Pontibacter arcticus]RAU84068.1 AraC family transcriptional regulator [Pontibacter arcticus]